MGQFMVDYFSLAVTHGLLALAAFRLMLRADLDQDPDPQSVDQPEEAAGGQDRKGARRA